MAGKTTDATATGLKEAIARVKAYVETYDDAPNWGGPTMYPAAPSTADLRALLAALLPSASVGGEREALGRLVRAVREADKPLAPPDRKRAVINALAHAEAALAAPETPPTEVEQQS